MKKETPKYSHKRAHFDYKIHQKWVAGIQLEGWEVKGLRNYMGDINGSHCRFNQEGNRLTLIGTKITPVSKEQITASSIELRSRNLLLNKSELKKIKESLKKGMTCIPLCMFCTDKGLWKVEIALVTGLKNWDKRQVIKERDFKRYESRNDK